VRSHGEIRSLSDIRTIARASSEPAQFDPVETAAWREARGRLDDICRRKAAG